MIILIILGKEYKLMKLLVMQFSPTSCHFISLRSKYSPQRPVPKHHHSCSSLECKLLLCTCSLFFSCYKNNSPPPKSTFSVT
jgi:hypothetical protein